MHRVLVTGATGLLGATLTRMLVEQGEQVRILRRESSATDLLGRAALGAEHMFGDVTDPESLAPAFANVSHVFHCAAALGEGRRGDAALLHRVNVLGTRHAVEAAQRAGVTRFLHTSSMAAFGRRAGQTDEIDESAEWTRSRENTPYATSKHDAELEVQRAVAEGLDAVIVNPALIFGPGRSGENTVQIVEAIRAGRMPGLPSGGTNVVDARDVAAAMIRAASFGKTGERYFLGSENLSWATILQTLAGAFGVPPPQRRVSTALALPLGAIGEALAYVTGTKPFLTRERVRQVSSTYRYSNAKATAELGATFRPFHETAAYLAAVMGRRGA